MAALRIVMVVLTLFVGSAAGAQDIPLRPIEPRLTDAVAVGQKLWMRRADGALLSLDLQSGKAFAAEADSVVDIAVLGGEVWVLQAFGPVFSIARPEGQYLRKVADFTAEADDRPIALLAGSGELIVVGGKTLRAFSGGRLTRTVTLQARLDAPTDPERRSRLGRRVFALSANGKRLYVGYDAGEWGGELRTIDTRSGEARSEDSDPVGVLIADSGRPDCVLAASGMNHGISSRSGVFRICPEGRTQVYAPPSKQGSLGVITEQVVDLVPTPDGFIAVMEKHVGSEQIGTAGDAPVMLGVTELNLERWRAAGTSPIPLPKTTPVAGFWISRQIQGVVMVRSGPEIANVRRDHRTLFAPTR